MGAGQKEPARVSPGHVRRLIIAILAGANLLVLGLAGYSLHHSRQQHELRARIFAQSMTRAVDQSLSHSIDKFDLALQAIADELQQQFSEGRAIDPRLAGTMLARYHQRLPELHSIRVSDREGRVILGRGVAPGNVASWGDREFFARLRDHPDAGLLVSPPMMGRVSKKMIVGFSRRYERPDGSFAGAVSATVDLDYFTRLLSGFNAGDNASIVLRDADLGLIARHPAVSGPAGEVGHRGVSRELQELVRTGVPEATYFTHSTSDGMERTVTFRRIEQGSMMVFVGVARMDYLAPWYGEAMKTAAAVGGFLVFSLVAGWVALRQQSRIVQESALNRLYLHHAHEGIIICDAGEAVLDVNPTFTEITGYGRGEVLGLTPRFLKSGRQDEEFYRAMWQAIRAKGHWQGELWNRKKDGTLYPERLTISSVFDDGGRVTHYIGTFSDISLLKRHQEELERMAHYDPLTGLPNRTLLAERMAQALPQASRAGSLVAVCYLDLDGFKAINDELGHDAGDLLLVEVARRLKDIVRAGDTVARLGGDEFVLLLIGVDGRQECERAAGRILRAIAEPILVKGAERSISGSLGIAIFPDTAQDSDSLLRHADQAMYQAKQAGKNRHVVFQPAPAALPRDIDHLPPVQQPLESAPLE